jgi:hypothetical protein
LGQINIDIKKIRNRHLLDISIWLDIKKTALCDIKTLRYFLCYAKVLDCLVGFYVMLRRLVCLVGFYVMLRRLVCLVWFYVMLRRLACHSSIVKQI